MKTALAWVATLLLATGACAQVGGKPDERAVAEKFGNDIAKAFNERDHEALAALFDIHAFALRSAEVQGLGGAQRDAFVGGVESAGVEKLAGTYFRALDVTHGNAKFMRVTNTIPRRSLVRLDLGEQGFNYNEYVIETDANGHARAVDWFQLATGELMSVTVGGLSQLFTDGNRGTIERLLGVRKVDEPTLALMSKYGALQRAGKYAEALEVLKQLPEPLASARMVLAARATAATFAKRVDEYDATLEKMATLYSDDPAASFMLIDYYYKRNDLAQMLKALNTMELRVGKDGVTNQLRAGAYFTAKDYTNAIKYAQESLRIEPERPAAYDTLAGVYIHSGRFQDAVDLYRGMETKFGFKFTREIFEKDPAYATLITSPAFLEWFPKK